MKKNSPMVVRRDYLPKNRVREMRMQAGLTQAELSERSGVHRITIANIERQKRQPSATTISLLSSALGVDEAVLAGSKKPRQWVAGTYPCESDYYLCIRVVPVGRSRLKTYAVLWFDSRKKIWYETRSDGSVLDETITVAAWMRIPDDEW